METAVLDERVVLRFGNPVAAPIVVDQSFFVPSRRLSSAGEGTGLGLAIVDRVTKLHGGTTTAACADGLFSTELSLPIEERPS